MWRSQIVTGIVLVVLSIPVYFLDQHLLKPGTGGWISLDFRGLFFWSYLILIALYLLISSLGIHFYQKNSLSSIHLVSGLLSIALVIVGYFTAVKVDHYVSHKEYEVRLEEHRALFDIIQLEEWNLVPNAQNPEEAHIKVRVSESGRFAGGVEGRQAGEYGQQIFAQDTQNQFQVSAGQEFTYVSKLKRYSSGEASDWKITLSLFKDQSGSVPENITKIFMNDPLQSDDGHFFYAELPLLTQQ